MATLYVGIGIAAMKDIFLSAGVPEPNDPEYGKTADPLLIHAAIRALCLVVLREYRIVWGGHPAITPMIWAACQNLGINYSENVILYQSNFFPKNLRPAENDAFKVAVNTPAQPDLTSSLLAMRMGMMTSHIFSYGIFIGGKRGVIDEYELFQKYHPTAKALILPSTGGAALKLSMDHPQQSAPAGSFVNFVDFLSETIK